MRAFRLLITVTGAALIGPAALLAPAAAASAATTASTPSIAALATANIGKKACSTNSEHGRYFESSCTGNGGQPEYWCADFARWVWSGAGVADTSTLNALAGSFYLYGQRYGTLSAVPAVGDAAVFNYDGTGNAEHVAIVTGASSDGTITTVSGDWGGQSGTEAHFASTSSAVLNTPAYPGTIGRSPAVMGMTISAYVAPVGVRVTPVVGESLLPGGQSLTAGMTLTSPNGLFSLTMQSDGNLVEAAGSRSLWSAGTSGAGNRVVMQRDGNLVVDSSSNAVLWSSGTGNHSGTISLAMRNDATLVVNGPSGAIWSFHPRTGTLFGGQTLLSGQRLMSSNGLFSLIMQSDGNLVEYTGGRPVWSSSSAGRRSSATMQSDGNFVVYNSSHVALWSSHSGGHTGQFSLVLMNDAHAVVNGPSGQLWANRV